MQPSWRMPTHVRIAGGCAREAPDWLRERRTSRALIVVDPGLADCAWCGELVSAIENSVDTAHTFTDFAANPRLGDAQRAAELAQSDDCEAVIAIGGGSAIDCAKAAAMLTSNDPAAVRSYVGRDLYPNEPLAMLAIPTTCGTGSEVTWVSVLSDPEAGTKLSIKGESMFPNQALVDHELLRSLPRSILAATAMDALTHALEATTCSLANPVSDALASEAIALIFEFLPRAYADLEVDAQAREAVMRASTLAGLAFGNADVAGVHCLSESLGGLFDVAHGLANAILLTPVLRSHRPHVDVRLAALLPRVLDGPPCRKGGAPAAEAGSEDGLRAAGDASAFLEALDALVQAVEIPEFSSLGVPIARFDEVAEAAETNGSNDSNPRPMKASDYREILDSLE